MTSAANPRDNSGHQKIEADKTQEHVRHNQPDQCLQVIGGQNPGPHEKIYTTTELRKLIKTLIPKIERGSWAPAARRALARFQPQLLPGKKGVFAVVEDGEGNHFSFYHAQAKKSPRGARAFRKRNS
jgi:hypothetical protein